VTQMIEELLTHGPGTRGPGRDSGRLSDGSGDHRCRAVIGWLLLRFLHTAEVISHDDALWCRGVKVQQVRCRLDTQYSTTVFIYTGHL